MLFVSGSKSQHVSEEWVVFHILCALDGTIGLGSVIARGSV
jgi:hypothetical protein